MDRTPKEFQSSIGLEDFNYPGTEQIVTKVEMIPDIVHCHNLHSDFFDLKQLAKISLNFPTLLLA